MPTNRNIFKKTILLWMLWMVLCWVSGESDALSLYRPVWSQLLQHAEVIVWAKVRHNQVISLANSLPVTQTTFDILKTYRGTPVQSITLSLLGGETQKIRVKLPSIPTFQPGSEVLLLLRISRHTRQHILVALYYGIFDILRSGSQIQAIHRGKLMPMMPLLALVSQFSPSSTQTLQKHSQSAKPTTKPASKKQR